MHRHQQLARLPGRHARGRPSGMAHRARISGGSSMIRFIPVAEITDARTIAMGLSGGSGTGKTFTALRIARGIAEVTTGKKGAPIGYVDTENKRALHYKEAFPEMCHFDFTA